MPYPQIVEYNEAVQHPAQAFVDSELRHGSIKENSLGLPLVLSGGFALTYTLSTSRKKYAVRCFHREIPSIEQKYSEISKKLKALGNGYFVDFDFQKSGIKVRQNAFPIVKMDWVEGDPLGVWLDKNFANASALQRAREGFAGLAAFLDREGIAHGDIQNGNVMLTAGAIKLIDYDGMFVPGLPRGKGSEVGHKHFQHPERAPTNFGPTMDRFSFIALDLSLQALIKDKALYKRFREGGETIIFKANDYADPQHSEIFQILLSEPKLKDHARNFSAICEADIGAVPTLAEFLAGKNIPAIKTANQSSSTAKTIPRLSGYIAAFTLVDALDFAAASRHVGDRVELIGRIVEVKPGVGRRGRGSGRPYIFINFGSWRGNIIKISIWSEGLEKLREKPSESWCGRWVSVTGLIDPPYTNRRFGYTHLSITVQEDGQIQQIDESQAQFRLKSVGKVFSPRNRDIVKAVIAGPNGGGTNQTRSPISNIGSKGGRSGGATSPNQAIVKKFKQGAVQPGGSGSNVGQAGAKKFAPQGATSGGFSNVPPSVWVIGGIILLFALLSSARLNRPTPAPLPPPDPPASRPSTWPPTPVQPPAVPRQLPEISPPLRKSEPLNNVPPPQNAGTANLQKQPTTSSENPPTLPAPIEIVPPARTPVDTATPRTSVPALQLDLGRIEDAKFVQARLIELGFLGGTADGIFGPRSRRALQEFRVAQKIGDSDAWDEATQLLLFDPLSARAPAINAAESFVGGWGADLAECGQVRGGRGPVSITVRRAEAFGTVCEFQSAQRDASGMWRLQATCANSIERWSAHIRLTVLGNKLTWSSERGTRNYVRCPGY